MYGMVHVKTNAYAGLEQFKRRSDTMYTTMNYLWYCTLLILCRVAHAFKTHSFPAPKSLVYSSKHVRPH